MSVTSGDLILYQSATMGTSFTTATIGGATSSTPITGGTVGEVLFTMGSSILGGGDKTQYEKVFVANTNASDDLTSSVVYIKNSLDIVVSNNIPAAVSTSASDDTTAKITVIGLDSAGAPQSEDIRLNGTASVTGFLTFSKIHRVELRNYISGLLQLANGDITISCGATALGIIPTGYKTATAEIDIGLVATLDDDGTTTTPIVAPSGISFTRPRTVATGLSVANAGTLTHAKGNGVWVKWVLAERANPSADVEVILSISGSTT